MDLDDSIGVGDGEFMDQAEPDVAESKCNPNDNMEVDSSIGVDGNNGEEGDLDMVDENDPPCAVCLDGETYELNEIVLCDKCNVAVHQSCYDVKVIPSGPWYCDPCRQGLDTTTLPCELCSNFGGAYKPVDKQGLWVHSLCYLWVPEIFTSEIKHQSVICLGNLDKKRFKLRCSLCTTKGACIQCHYGRCATAAHPWCVHHKPQGFTRRIVKDEDGVLVWEIFCKAHAFAVTEPLKPKSKAKVTNNDSFSAYDNSLDESFGNKHRKSENGKNSRSYSSIQPLSMSHSFKFMNITSHDVCKEKLNDVDDIDDMDDYPKRSRQKKRIVDDDDEDDSEIDFQVYKPTKASKQPLSSSIPASNSGTDISDLNGQDLSFPIFTLSEWPGQAEGEVLDMDHFWNVVSMMHSEDHCHEWVEYMASCLPRSNETPNLMKEPFMCLPCNTNNKNGNTAELSTRLEEKYNELNSDKDRAAVLDLEKRRQLIQHISRRVFELNQSTDRVKLNNNLPEEILGYHHLRSQLTLSERVVSNTTYCDTLAREGIQYHNATATEARCDPEVPASSQIDTETKDVLLYPVLNDHQFYTKRMGTSPPCQELEEFDDTNSASLQVALDGENVRYHLIFRLVSESATLDPNSKKRLLTELDEYVHTGKLNPSDAGLIQVLRNEIQQHIIGPNSSSESSLLDADADDICRVSVQLEDISSIADSYTLNLPDRVIISKDQDDIIARLIRSDQENYFVLQKALAARIDQLLRVGNIAKRSDTHTAMRNQWAKIEATYLKQRVWKRVAASALKGMRDQKHTDLLKQSILPDLPASWTVNVDGRPAPPIEEEEHSEDSVCMVCFDGVSVEANQILFCDGCNAALHQSCYGVAEIPEGDFFCNRCLGIQAIASEIGPSYDCELAKDEIKCCLCPLYHGGLKMTTDGRWVHLCCALWSPTRIVDLNEMSPIDVSAVPIQIPVEPLETTSKGRKLSRQSDEMADYDAAIKKYNLTISPIAGACIYCNVAGGYVRQCCYGSGVECPVVFHPLCAWFKGDMVIPTLTDPSFQGKERDGQFPSGVTYAFYCTGHSTDVGSDNSREFQITFRNKHRIVESDLEVIPGRGGKKKRKKKSSASSNAAGSVGRSAGGNVQKELNPDIYPSSICAFCMIPIESLAMVAVDSIELPKTVAVAEGSENVVECAAVSPESKEADTTEKVSSPEQSTIDIMEVVAVPNVRANGSVEFESAALSVPTLIAAPTALVCKQCKVAFHASCHISLGGSLDTAGSAWLCDVCAVSAVDPRCELCPRRRGGYKVTQDGSWAHVFCARNCPGQIKISPEGVIDIRTVPKESRRQKCCICNRKNGSCIRCSCLGCTNYFHPLCGERSGKAYIISRLGEVQSFCSDHIPEGVEKLSSGYWVDPFELQRLRYTLDRARIVLDTICRREKLKRLICKMDSELFSSRFDRALDKAKGRKSTLNGEMDVAELFEDEDDYLSDENYDDDGEVADAVVVSRKDKPVPKDITVKTNWPEPEEVVISGSWTKNNEVKVPKKVYINFGGLEVSKYDRSLEEPKKDFVRILKEKTQNLLNASRAECSLVFKTEAEAAEFAKALPAQLIKHMKMNSRAFAKEVLSGTDVKPTGSANEKQRKAGKSELSSPEPKKKRSRVEQDTDQLVPESVVNKGSDSRKSVSKRPLAAVEPELEPVAVVAVGVTPEKRRGRPPAKHLQNPSDQSAVSNSFKNSDADEEGRNIGNSFDQSAVYASIKLDRTYCSKSVLVSKKIPHLNDHKISSASLQDNICFTAMVNKVPTFNLSVEGFGNVLLSSGITADANIAQIGSSWEVCTGEELLALERRLLDVLNEIMLTNSPVAGQVECAKDDPDSQLAGDFIDLPAEALPDYHTYVRRQICISQMKARLLAHGYRSVAAFEKDFFDMLNNGKSVTGEESQTSIDAHRMAEIYRTAIKQSYENPAAVSRVQAGNLESKRVDKRSQKSASPTGGFEVCGHCNAKFEKANWPKKIESCFDDYISQASEAASAGKRGKSKRSKLAVTSGARARQDWKWYCRNCLNEMGTDVLGWSVLVWWADDEELYPGKIEAFDSSSGRFRILYEDQEWEFISIAAEPLLFSNI